MPIYSDNTKKLSWRLTLWCSLGMFLLAASLEMALVTQPAPGKSVLAWMAVALPFASALAVNMKAVLVYRAFRRSARHDRGR